MNPPSLRELCRHTTPGPWKATGETVVAPVKPGGWRLVCHVSNHITAGNDGDLIARLSPATALAVYEALNYARSVIVPTVHFSPGSIDPPEGPEPVDKESEEGAMCISHIDRCLALLDGRTEP